MHDYDRPANRNCVRKTTLQYQWVIKTCIQACYKHFLQQNEGIYPENVEPSHDALVDEIRKCTATSS